MHRFLPPHLFTMLLAAMILAAWVSPWPDAPLPARILGAAVFTLGLVINVRNAKLFDTVGTNIVTFTDPDVLVCDGAFSWTRNPMYLGFLLMLIGVGTALGSAIAFVGPLAFFLVADRWYIPFEEKRMALTFGNDYYVYKRAVRRWIGPRGL